MKPECIPCLVDVRCREVIRVLNSSQEAYDVCMEIVQRLSELLRETSYTTKIATELYRVVRGRLSIDPYRSDKKRANRWALKILPKAMDMIDKLNNPLERFRAAARLSLIGNAIDPGVSGYTFNLTDLEHTLHAVKLSVDECVEAYERSRGASEVLYLCDNSGEIVLDRLLVRELKRMGAEVTVVVRSEPYQNDATMEDVRESGMISEADQIIEAGDGAYLSPETLPKPFVDRLKKTDLTVLKGMANYENLELLQEVRETGYLLLLKAKCRPIAESLNVERGGYVVKLV